MARCATGGRRSQLEAVLGTRHLESFSVDFDSYMDNLMCRACHGKPLPCTARGAASEACVTEQMLRQVEVEGDWHYQFLYRCAPARDMRACASTGGGQACVDAA